MKRAVLVLTVLALALAATGALAASSPTVKTGAATGVGNTTATLNGSVNPNGAATTYHFEWGLTGSYGASTPSHSAGSGSTSVSVHSSLTHLTPGTTYHYRLVATNKSGASNGADRTFTTTGHPPASVTTEPATSISTSSAVANGLVNPHGQATTWNVQYGTSPSYGVQTFSGSLAPGTSAVPVAITLNGLAPATIFHYRVVASHGSSAISYGADQQFMTYPAIRPVPTVHARTTPARRRQRPYAFTTTGRVSHPSWIPAAYACTGQVRVRWFIRHHAIKTVKVPLGSNCTFTAQSVFMRHWRHPLNGIVRFLGTGYLAPAPALHPSRITLG